MGIARTLAQRDMVCYDFALDRPNLNALVLAGTLSISDESRDAMLVLYFEEQAVEAVQGILHEMDLRVTNLTALTLALT
jgi:hypothetical protein